jgi:MFS family permease
LALLASLAVFWFGFILRPFGAIYFGHLGDLIGRKFTFMLTLGMMGLATFLISCIPSYETWGIAAPIPDPAGARDAGLGSRRRIWRCCDLHRGARARRRARPLYELDSIFASALGTVFEWHDFYLYATLALRCREAMKP